MYNLIPSATAEASESCENARDNPPTMLITTYTFRYTKEMSYSSSYLGEHVELSKIPIWRSPVCRLLNYGCVEEFRPVFKAICCLKPGLLSHLCWWQDRMFLDHPGNSRQPCNELLLGVNYYGKHYINFKIFFILILVDFTVCMFLCTGAQQVYSSTSQD